MGSLYNNFSFPKLDSLEMKDIDNGKRSMQYEAYPPLQQKPKLPQT